MQADQIQSRSNRPVSTALRVLVGELDPLVIATALAMASLTPGPAGEAGALAAIAFDIKHKRWYGVALSAASMIPIIGYIPAVFKVGFLLFLLNRHLNSLEAMLSEVHDFPEGSILVGSALVKYCQKVPDMWLTRPLLKRFRRIMDLDKRTGLSGTPLSAGVSPADTSTSSEALK
jgi:hypothetical protein